jgi:hypothetical protein
MSFNRHFPGAMKVEDGSVAEDNRNTKGSLRLDVAVQLLELFSVHEGYRYVGVAVSSPVAHVREQGCRSRCIKEVPYGDVVVPVPSDAKYLLSEASGLVLGHTRPRIQFV